VTTLQDPLPANDHAHGHGHGHDHPPHLAHHWETPKQQFEAGKLGMWLFLATEVLLFGGLFCGYAVWRGNHPELFKYGSHFLNTTLGATNTAVLILSSLTMAWGVTAAQQNKQGLLKLMLILTLCGAATFLVIKFFEYKHKFDEGYFPGIKFYEPPSRESDYWAEGYEAAQSDLGEGGGTLVSTPPVESSTTTAAAAPSTGAAANGASGAAASAPSALVSPAPGVPAVEPSVVAPAALGPTGLRSNAQLVEEPFKMHERHSAAEVHPLRDPHRPPNAHMFFNIYFMMTGLHGIHVVVGMIVICWLLVKSFRGEFSDQYFTPVDLGGLYWHIVDLIWIFLFPLFYLI
jgi:cytochrome c oxidase subunit 3